MGQLAGARRRTTGLVLSCESTCAGAFPLTVVIGHGVLAVTTLVLVVLAMLGV
jgi:hypothetical protein